MTLKEIRKAKTSELIAMLNPDTLISTLHDAMTDDAFAKLTRTDLAEITQMVCDEIDRRCPVPR